MNFLSKGKYAKFSRILNELDYMLSNLIEQCKRDIAELQYLPLSEHQMRVFKGVLQDIADKCSVEQDKVEKGLRLTNGAVESLSEIDVVSPVKSIIYSAQKHTAELKSTHNEILASFKRANLREKALASKIHSADEESERE